MIEFSPSSSLSEAVLLETWINTWTLWKICICIDLYLLINICLNKWFMELLGKMLNHFVVLGFYFKPFLNISEKRPWYEAQLSWCAVELQHGAVVAGFSSSSDLFKVRHCAEDHRFHQEQPVPGSAAVCWRGVGSGGQSGEHQLLPEWSSCHWSVSVDGVFVFQSLWMGRTSTMAAALWGSASPSWRPSTWNTTTTRAATSPGRTCRPETASPRWSTKPWPQPSVRVWISLSLFQTWSCTRVLREWRLLVQVLASSLLHRTREQLMLSHQPLLSSQVGFEIMDFSTV